MTVGVGGRNLSCHVDFRLVFELWLPVFAGIFEVAGVVVADLTADDAQYFRL
jgi:hypothetical protein